MAEVTDADRDRAAEVTRAYFGHIWGSGAEHVTPETKFLTQRVAQALADERERTPPPSGTERPAVSRWERAVTRTAAGLCLLLWLCLPVGFVAAIWTAEERWFWTGIVLCGVGFALGWLLREGERVKR